MPRVKRKAKSKRMTGYTERHIYHLLRGHDFFGKAFGQLDHEDWEAMREAWNKLRDDLLPQFIRENPGRRPFAWWKFDALDRRRCLNRDIHPFDDPRRKKVIGDDKDELFYGLHYGLPRVSIGPDFLEPWPVYESEEAYLRRLNLLTPEEIELLESAENGGDKCQE